MGGFSRATTACVVTRPGQAPALAGAHAFRLLIGCVSHGSQYGRTRAALSKAAGAEAWPPPPDGDIHQARPPTRAPPVHVYARGPQICRSAGKSPADAPKGHEMPACAHLDDGAIGAVKEVEECGVGAKDREVGGGDGGNVGV